MSHTDDELDEFSQWERQVWESRAAPYAASMTRLTGGAAPALLDAAGVGAGTAMLDVATGPGVVAALARDRGATVIAVDQSEAMVNLARTGGIDAHQASVEQLPFDDATFDAVVAGFLLNHLARPAKGISEMARVCRGRVALSVWDMPAANPVLGLFGSVAASLDAPDAVPPGPASDMYADEDRLRSVLEDAGLDQVEVRRVGWTLTVEPGEWFEAVAASTPRTGAVLADVQVGERATLRKRYVEVATTSFGGPDGRVTLPAGAVVASGRPRSG
ncbi:MAG: class I SAM-dependent methyltransferase [Actinomycetota bacterium]|nr:class I SAM-dependent methyltransferase [Actinomycetota bacterium]